jgi:hypothetical protein
VEKKAGLTARDGPLRTQAAARAPGLAQIERRDPNRLRRREAMGPRAWMSAGVTPAPLLDGALSAPPGGSDRGDSEGSLHRTDEALPWTPLVAAHSVASPLPYEMDSDG